jgi:hypothetical protein
MSRRFFLVAIEPKYGWDTREPEPESAMCVQGILKDSFAGTVVAIPVDKVTAVVGATWAGVPVEDVIGMPEPTHQTGERHGAE